MREVTNDYRGVIHDSHARPQRAVRPLVVLASRRQRRMLVEPTDTVEQPHRKRHVRRKQDVAGDQRRPIRHRLVGCIDREDDAIAFRFDASRQDRITDVVETRGQPLQPIGSDTAVVVCDRHERGANVPQS
jgi:hypothetical protein